MHLKQGDIWTDFDQLDYVCTTTNSVVKRNGELVMGAGHALQAQQRFPGLALDLGRQIQAKGASLGFYGLLLSDKILAFQTKIHFNDNSPIEVVQRSTDMLRRLALKYPERTFGLPFPGISNGKLDPTLVYPYLQQLPDNVTVYHKRPLYLE